MVSRRVFLLTATCMVAAAARPAMAFRTFDGLGFSVDIPPGFRPETSLREAGGTVSAFFVSPDGMVSFYAHRGSETGLPIDVAVDPDLETLEAEATGREFGHTAHWTTISARNGTYRRSYVQLIGADAIWTVGLRYSSDAAYARHRDDYLRFKASFLGR